MYNTGFISKNNCKGIEQIINTPTIFLLRVDKSI